MEEAWLSPTSTLHVATDLGGGGDITAAIVEGGEAGGMAGAAMVAGYEPYPAPHAHHAHNTHHAAQYQYAGAEWGQYHPHPHQVPYRNGEIWSKRPEAMVVIRQLNRKQMF